MRRPWIPAAVLTTLLAGLGGALAAPGSADDPFVTQSYLTGYLAQAEEAIVQRVQAGTAQTLQDALDELEQRAAGYLLTAGAQDSTLGFFPVSLEHREQLLLSPGSSVLVLGGSGRLVLDSGVLVDVTAGSETAAGSVLTAGHRYLAAEELCTLTANIAGVDLSIQGFYLVEDAAAVVLPFTDVTSEHWFYPSVCYVYEAGLFNGMTPTLFDPAGSMNRAMLVVVLSRMAGVEATAPDAGFRDVPAGTWFTNAVNWAAQTGIVDGMGDNRFAPEQPVSREQMATLLYRYARDYAGLDVSAAGDVTAFSDSGEISSWAKEGVSWAVAVGLLQGDSGRLRPGGSASRADVATLLERFAAVLDGAILD